MTQFLQPLYLNGDNAYISYVINMSSRELITSSGVLVEVHKKKPPPQPRVARNTSVILGISVPTADVLNIPFDGPLSRHQFVNNLSS